MVKYCTSCGSELEKDQNFCPNCGAPREEKEKKEATTERVETSSPVSNGTQKSKLTAGLLGIFLGVFGVHNFYLGYTGKAIGQLLLTLLGWILCGLGPIAAWVWGLVEGILILTGSMNVDADGNLLGE